MICQKSKKYQETSKRQKVFFFSNNENRLIMKSILIRNVDFCSLFTQTSDLLVIPWSWKKEILIENLNFNEKYEFIIRSHRKINNRYFKRKKMLKIFVDSLYPEILFTNLDNSFSMAPCLVSSLGMLPPTVLGQEMLNYLGKVR